MMKEVSEGGTRGLQVISLAECKNVTDAGMIHLKNLKFLSKVILLGCMSIKDAGVKEIALHTKYLEDLDIGGTNVTGEGLRDLVSLCLNIRRVNISGCKQLNASDDQILRKNKINVESGEDIFRFYLKPHDSSDLPSITTSVLKTRGTLSMNKVFKYLIKKLVSDRALEEVSEDKQADQVVEILCKDHVLNPFM